MNWFENLFHSKEEFSEAQAAREVKANAWLQASMADADEIQNDYELRVKGLSNYNLAEMLAEKILLDKGLAALDHNEEKAKQLKYVEAHRESAEKKLLKLIGEHTQIDWKESFKKFKEAEPPTHAKPKEMYKPAPEAPGKQNWDKKADFEALTDKEQAATMDGVGHEEDKNAVGNEKLLKEQRKEAFQKQASKYHKTLSFDLPPNYKGTITQEPSGHYIFIIQDSAGHIVFHSSSVYGAPSASLEQLRDKVLKEWGESGHLYRDVMRNEQSIENTTIDQAKTEDLLRGLEERHFKEASFFKKEAKSVKCPKCDKHFTEFEKMIQHLQDHGMSYDEALKWIEKGPGYKAGAQKVAGARAIKVEESFHEWDVYTTNNGGNQWWSIGFHFSSQEEALKVAQALSQASGAPIIEEGRDKKASLVMAEDDASGGDEAVMSEAEEATTLSPDSPEWVKKTLQEANEYFNKMNIIPVEEDLIEYLATALENETEMDSEQAFQKATELWKMHMESSLKTAATTCPICNKKFENINEYATHKEKAHKVEKPREYKCPTCNATFDNWALYNTHRKTHTKAAALRKQAFKRGDRLFYRGHPCVIREIEINPFSYEVSVQILCDNKRVTVGKNELKQLSDKPLEQPAIPESSPQPVATPEAFPVEASLEKKAEIKSPWQLMKDKDGKEVIARVTPNKTTKESEQVKKASLEKKADEWNSSQVYRNGLDLFVPQSLWDAVSEAIEHNLEESAPDYVAPTVYTSALGAPEGVIKGKTLQFMDEKSLLATFETPGTANIPVLPVEAVDIQSPEAKPGEKKTTEVDLEKIPTVNLKKKRDELLDQLNKETDPTKKEQIKERLKSLSFLQFKLIRLAERRKRTFLKFNNLEAAHRAEGLIPTAANPARIMVTVWFDANMYPAVMKALEEENLTENIVEQTSTATDVK